MYDGRKCVHTGDREYYVDMYDGSVALDKPDISCIEDIQGLDEVWFKIRTIAITGSTIQTLDGIEKLRYLEVFMCSDHLQSLEGIQNCERLRLLKASGNKIDSMAPLASLERLEFVELQDNQIARIEGLGGKRALKALDLSNNHIKKIEGLDDCSHLERLNLHNNAVECIEGLDHVHTLVNLDLGDNNINIIQDLENLPRLAVLGLSNNHIEKLEHLGALEALEFLNLMNNDIKCIENIDHLSAEVNLAANPAIETEVDVWNHNPVLWCVLKGGLDRMCDDLETRVASRIDDQLEPDRPFETIIPLPGHYIDSFLHLADAYMHITDHPAGKALDHKTGGKNSPTRERDKERRIRFAAMDSYRVILNTAGLFGMILKRDTETELLVPSSSTRLRDSTTFDVRGWAALLRRVVPPIVTFRWPDYLMADQNGMIVNNLITVDETTNESWRYFEARFHFLPSKLFTRQIFGRTKVSLKHLMWMADWFDIYVFKPETVEGISWADFVENLDSFKAARKDQYFVFQEIRDLRKFLINTSSEGIGEF